MSRQTSTCILEQHFDSETQTEIWTILSRDIPRISLLLLAWKWCHQLETTALMVRLIHRTQQLWNMVFGDLRLLPNLQYGPPVEGYAVKDMGRCR